MRVDKRLSPADSNSKIKELINSNKPFSITRVGLGGETAVSALTLSNQFIPDNIKNWFYTNAGFYGTDDFFNYATKYKASLDNSDCVSYWNFPGFIEMEDFLVKEDKELIDISALEAFRFKEPWTEFLKKKKVLIINPFKNTIDKQLINRTKIWKNQNILPEADWIVYQSVQSIGGIGPHKDWFESFNKMCDDITKIDFDIALLGCGSYGLPLTDFIKTQLNKSAIYVGGGLQLYFGIIGKRWEGDEIKSEMNEYWTRPDQDEKPLRGNLVEGGCYW
jgi:hypothetical protein